MGKKKFNETGFGKFLAKAGDTLKDKGANIAGIAIKVATGNISGAIADATGMLKGDSSSESQALLTELELRMKEFEIEMYQLEIQDRDSARNREVEIKKAGGNDIMMIITGSVGLLAFLVILYTILFRTLPIGNEKLVYHLLGVVEGVSFTIFAYYFGSSKGSKDKSSLLSKN
tara:strand:+ start:908 stop:1426 length:519 start_codon:yes stop_codon:yes gene_type:complete